MQDCPNWYELQARALISVRWCPEHDHWVFSAWAKKDGDSPFEIVHPMWDGPRVVPDDDYADGTLRLLLTAAQRTARRLADESAGGQLTLW